MAKAKQPTLEWLRSISGELATTTLKQLDLLLPWYRDMEPERKSAVGLVAQTGIGSFVAWYESPGSQPWVAADVFSTAPRELIRTISLLETLQLIRVVVEVVEARVVQENPSLREAVLLYSREIAFSAADVYARAAEARGLWDARLESLVVDSILSDETEAELSSRVAALGWRAKGEVSVLIGTAPEPLDQESFRRVARKLGADILLAVHGTRLVLVLGQLTNAENSTMDAESRSMKVAEALVDRFAPGPIVVGVPVKTVSLARRSAKTALAAFSVVESWPKAPRPVFADDLLAERALAGDQLAKTRLVERIYVPLIQNSLELLETLTCYLDTGRSLEATARELFVHPNTVRYRLKRITDLIGWDATGARESFVLQVAIILGSMSEHENRKRR